jgi:hypothetical protein
MMITTNASGLKALQKRVGMIQKAIKPTLQTAVRNGGIKAEYRFSMAAPNGKSIDSTTIPGDAPGKLLQSFDSKPLRVFNGAGVTVFTKQPVKLKFVVGGTGLYGPLAHRIYPLKAKALYWQGAAHPYRSIAGMRPNDFVTPTQPLAKQDIRDAVKQAMYALLGGL